MKRNFGGWGLGGAGSGGRGGGGGGIEIEFRGCHLDTSRPVNRDGHVRVG